MMLTFITPVSPDHVQYLPACVATVKEQTIPCQHLIMHDPERRGPAVIRNRLLGQATTDYVTFLDADDWVEPDFAEKMLAAIRRATYVFSDWWQDGEHKQAPERPWCGGTFHLVTAVVPRTLAIQIGGFDESLPALEDTAFYLEFLTREWCGTRVPYPLVHYRVNGGRSDAIHKNEYQLTQIRAELAQRFGRRGKMGCCGNPTEVDNHPVGEQQPGDVLAMALWGGNRTEHGRATGRRYPRMSYPHTTWVDPLDIKASPHLWKAVQPEPEAAKMPQIEIASPIARGVDAIREGLAGWGTIEEVSLLPEQSPVAAIPNTNLVKRLAGALDLPVFVTPHNTYPSYTDFWKLVQLGGFEVLFAEEIDLADGDRTYIFTGPEGIPDCTGAKARTIFWQLEYTGDYTDQPNHLTVKEVWSSDPEHARLTDSRFVLMGSHKGLNPSGAVNERIYDLAMLAYMTPRRVIIKDALDEYGWAPDYPGYGNAERDRVLSSTRLMINVNQFDEPTLAPLRLALAAAYALPVLAEKVPNGKPYKKAIMWSAYSRLASNAKAMLRSGNDEARGDMGRALYTLLCEEHPFFDCVMEALK